MFIIRRCSKSGGSQYLVEGVHSRYRWSKTAIQSARKFTTKSSATKLANTYGGDVVSVRPIILMRDLH